MKQKMEYYLPLLLLLLSFTATHWVSGTCEDNFNCTECTQSNCSYYQCGNATKCVPISENYNCTDQEKIPVIISELHKCPNQTSDVINSSSSSSSSSSSPVSDSPVSTFDLTNTTTTTTTTTTVTTTSSPATTVPDDSTGTINTNPSTINRRFDGPSFIGGIILALGLLAIAYVGLKFYRARTERNYHTLLEIMRESNYSSFNGR